ncbi:MAG: hypothetical protein ACKVQR_23045 [Aquabacterium sp.]
MIQAALPLSLPPHLPLFAPIAARRPADPARPALPLHPGGALAEAAPDRIGFEIGWDHAQWRLTPPLAHLHAGSSVRQGWAAGRAVIGNRSRKPTAAHRQWLQLRLQAWQQGASFESLQVTPRWLGRLAAPLCPVTRRPLAADCAFGAELQQIVRLNRHAAYAAGNLAALAPAAADAASRLSWDQARAMAEQAGAQPNTAPHDLGAAAWLRLAVLMSLAAPLPHALAASLPLVVLPAPAMRVLNPVQALQVALTRLFLAPQAAARIHAWATLMPDAETHQATLLLLHTLLARRLALPATALPLAVTHLLEDAWTDPLVQRRWQRLALRLTAAACERLLQAAPQRGLADPGLRWLPVDQATDGWALHSAGQAAAPTMAGAAH